MVVALKTLLLRLWSWVERRFIFNQFPDSKDP
jgi:hypothetical protein